MSKGATLHVGGTIDDEKGAYFAPAVLTGVTPEMSAYERRSSARSPSSTR